MWMDENQLCKRRRLLQNKLRIARLTGLKKAGHTVRVLTSQDFQSLVTGYGLEFYGTGGDMQAIAQSMQMLLEQGNLIII